MVHRHWNIIVRNYEELVRNPTVSVPCLTFTYTLTASAKTLALGTAQLLLTHSPTRCHVTWVFTVVTEKTASPTVPVPYLTLPNNKDIHRVHSPILPV